ncbi:glycogen-binding domain-containing protein, partial [bacterium]|nr:glycogen-binding domain-containing protein [bacterium]
MRAKAHLSKKLPGARAFELNVMFPPSPIISGTRINFKISLKTLDTKIDIKQTILQIAGNRWKLGDENTITLTPQGKALTFTGSFSLPPSTGLGIVQLPLFIDFLSGGKRIEIHKRKSLIIKEGFEATLNFPSGKRIKKQLPLTLILKYNPGHSIQGSLEGIFCDPLRCIPKLPSKFRIKAGSRITELPLTISSGKALPPGKFPFSLKLYLNGKAIAEFNDILTNPIDWLQLGPLSDKEWILENGWRYQDDLGKTHIGKNGNTVSWKTVPYGATGENGEILLSRLYGTNSDNCCLLYTIMKLPFEKEVSFQINTSNKISMWLNSNLILSGTRPGNSRTHAKLRRGQNSILIAASWDKSPSPLIFEISDKSGLPVGQMKNTMNEIAGKFANLDPEKSGNETNPEGMESPREITFSIVLKNCSRIAVIGSFNSWNPKAAPMVKTEEGIWKTTIVISPGRYSYKFLIDNKIRISDSSCKLEEADGFGGVNSVLIVK